MYYYDIGVDEGQKLLIAETEADIAKLPTSTASGDTTASVGTAHHTVAFGSKAKCVETGDTYMLTSNNQWTKYSSGSSGGGGGGSGAGLPEVTSADNGDLLGVVEGEWGKVDPPAELPAVTSSDNGSLLGVSNGAWDKVDPPADTFTVTLTKNDGNWTADKTIAEILAANAAGKQCVATAIIDDTTVFFPLVTTSQGLVQFAGTSYTESANATYVAGIIDGSADEWFLNSVEITNELPAVTSSDNGSLLGVSNGAWGKVAAPAELPAVTGADNGSLLGVSNGAWAKVTAPTELPAVTGADNGSLLGVSSGAWAKVANSMPLVVQGALNDEAVTITTPLATIKAAYDAGRMVYLFIGGICAGICSCDEDDGTIVVSFAATLYVNGGVVNYTTNFVGELTAMLIVTELTAST